MVPIFCKFILNINNIVLKDVYFGFQCILSVYKLLYSRFLTVLLSILEEWVTERDLLFKVFLVWQLNWTGKFIKQLWMIWRMQIASIHLNDNIDDNTDFDQP